MSQPGRNDVLLRDDSVRPHLIQPLGHILSLYARPASQCLGAASTILIVGCRASDIFQGKQITDIGINESVTLLLHSQGSCINHVAVVQGREVSRSGYLNGYYQ